jgi:ubiquinone/menaquinone biosynthesis C-methylase UbiE
MAQKIGSNPNIFASELFDGLPARYDRLGWLLSLGQDRRWRNA